MNPRDYTTWISFADHPIFADKSRPAAEWSSDPAVYDDFLINEFQAEWCVHTDPPLPTDVQQAIAERDLNNFAAACHDLQQAFGDIDHELFILDDLTVYVSIRCDHFHIELYSHDYGDHDEVLSVYVLEPCDDDFTVNTVSELIPSLQACLKRS